MANEPAQPSLLYRLFRKVLSAFFRAFYLFEVKGLEHVPTTGPVIIAANHINVFDAMMIAACVPRPVRFVAWNRTFTMRWVGWFMRATHSIPVDREKPDPSAFKESLRWLAGGNILGIFPEGSFTTDGHMLPIKTGTARIAVAAGATIVPATLVGSYRSWPAAGPAKKAFPRPWKVMLTFHAPLRVDHSPSNMQEEKAAAQDLTRKIADAINSTLEPGLRAEEKIDRLVEQPAPHIRIYEWFLCVVLLLAFVLGQWEWRALLIAVFYIGYLLADIHLVRQSRRTRFARNFAPVVMLAAAFPSLWRVVGPLEQSGSADMARLFDRIPKPLAWLLVDGWFLCYLLMLPYALWAMITYCFEKYLQFQRFVRGFLVTLYLGLLQLMIFPSLRVEFPVAVNPGQRGLYVQFFGWTDPVREAKLLWLPGLIVSLSAFALSFDFAHNLARFRVMWFFVLNAWISAVVLRGYPLSSVLLNFATVALVYLYMHVFKFHAHDGRRI